MGKKNPLILNGLLLWQHFYVCHETQGRHLYCPRRGLLQLYGAHIDPEYWLEFVLDFKIQEMLLETSEEMRTMESALIWKQEEPYK